MPIIFDIRKEIDLALHGWKREIVVAPAFEATSFTPRLVEIVKEGEMSMPGYIPGVMRCDVMLTRAKELRIATGLRHAEAMLRNQARIPAEWRDFFPVFPGEIWESPAGIRYIFGLAFDATPKWWSLCFYSNLLGGLGYNTRLVA